MVITAPGSMPNERLRTVGDLVRLNPTTVMEGIIAKFILYNTCNTMQGMAKPTLGTGTIPAGTFTTT